MTDTKLAACLLAGVALLAGASTASAQSAATDKIFVSANIGGQLASRTLDTTSSLTVYEETATLGASTPIDAGVMYDFGAGYRVWGDLFVGVTVSVFSTTSNAATTARVPNPLFFNRFATVTGTATDLKHRELAVLPQLIYRRALTDKVDLQAGIGPALISLKQDVVGSFAVPAGTQNVNPALTEESVSGTGIAASLDLTYKVGTNWGIGGFARYAGAKVELESGANELNVGGMQAGAGIRLRF
jgi:hypothetical protein